MSTPPELKLLRSIKTGKGLIRLIDDLQKNRRISKVPGIKRSALTQKQRQLIFEKTNGRCHICGIELDVIKFQADHVKSHSSGGDHPENNYLPSCATCNNYRWHYSSEEIQIILKLGVWFKKKIARDLSSGPDLANEFVKHEIALRKSRKATLLKSNKL
jgi:hypothetical protein